MAARYRHVFAALAVISVIGCGSSQSAAPTQAPPSAAGSAPGGAPSASASVASSPSTSPSPTSTTATLNSQVYWSGYQITVKSATFDASQKTLHVTASFKNTADGPQEPVYADSEVTVTWQGQTFGLSSESSGSIAPNTSNDRTLFASLLPDGFTLTDATVTFGKSGQHQASVPLSGASATSEQPQPLTLSGTFRMELASFKLTRGEVVPAECFATNSGLTFVPGNAKDVAILIRGDAIAHASLGFLGSVNITGGDIKPPTGDRIGAVSQNYINLTPGERERDQAMCFTVPAPAKGTYQVRMAMDMKAGSTVSIRVP